MQCAVSRHTLCLLLALQGCRGQIDDEADGVGGIGGGDGGGGGGGGGATKAAAPSCTLSAKGATYNLAGMKRDDHDYTGTTPGGYTYRFNVCGGTVKVCNSQAAPASKWRGTKCNNLGDMQTQEIGLVDAKDPGKGVKITYKDGDICKKQINGQMEISSRQINYEIECSGDDPAVLKHIDEVSMCEYTVTFASKYGCPVGSHRGRGWKFVILVLTSFFLYFAIGFGIKYQKYGMRGAEAVPNVDMWRQVPGLVKDGVSFTAGGAKVGYGVLNEKVFKGKLPNF